MMFNTKEEFKEVYRKTLERNYGRSLEESHITEKYLALGNLVREMASENWVKTKQIVRKNQEKQMHYFSMEFLLGRLLTSNLINLGVYDIVKEGLAELGIDINQLEDLEADAGLGNGGLGRLAACFIDSIASLGYIGHGNTLRYEYGLFKQKIIGNKQVETPDNWLNLGNVHEVRKPKHAVEIKLYGHLNMTFDQNMKAIVELKDPMVIKAVPYDVPVIGYKNNVTNTLRLWKAEPADNLEKVKDFQDYITRVRKINQNLYPSDEQTDGKLLRLTQQYMICAAGLKTIVKEHLRVYPSLDNLAEKIVIQLNDTHPVLAIPELMRILLDEYDYSWDHAWQITTGVFNYTNHTILSEALEKWPINLVQRLLPRVYLIIDEIHKRFVYDLMNVYHVLDLSPYLILRDGMVHMANLAIVGSTKVNGVAQLHTNILINNLFKQFYAIWPEKFNNKTNGITHRRWLTNCNPELTSLITDKIGDSFITHPEDLGKLMDYVDDDETINRFLEIKLEKKKQLAAWVKKNLNIDVDVNSIFDCQAKRIHAYKRQMLNALHIAYLYRRMKEDPSFRITPTTYFFAGKAASSYYFAKKNIEFICTMAEVINNDPETNQFLKVVFIPNYCVSVAEILMPACDVSEQISTASKEASGTGNMKFMMNGAITCGTLDGANVEIAELVGPENIAIFGLNADQVLNLYAIHSYNSRDYYMNDRYLKSAVDSLIDGTFTNQGKRFDALYEEFVFKNDEYLVFVDFESYRQAQKRLKAWYTDRRAWGKACLINIAKSAKFSSDRTIEEYVEDIWHLNKVEVK